MSNTSNQGINTRETGNSISISDEYKNGGTVAIVGVLGVGRPVDMLEEVINAYHKRMGSHRPKFVHSSASMARISRGVNPGEIGGKVIDYASYADADTADNDMTHKDAPAITTGGPGYRTTERKRETVGFNPNQHGSVEDEPINAVWRNEGDDKGDGELDSDYDYILQEEGLDEKKDIELDRLISGEKIVSDTGSDHGTKEYLGIGKKPISGSKIGYATKSDQKEAFANSRGRKKFRSDKKAKKKLIPLTNETTVTHQEQEVTSSVGPKVTEVTGPEIIANQQMQAPQPRKVKPKKPEVLVSAKIPELRGLKIMGKVDLPKTNQKDTAPITVAEALAKGGHRVKARQTVVLPAKTYKDFMPTGKVLGTVQFDDKGRVIPGSLTKKE